MEDFRSSAKKYVEDMYTQHKEDDIEAWNRLIDIIFDYVSESVKNRREHKNE